MLSHSVAGRIRCCGTPSWCERLLETSRKGQLEASISQFSCSVMSDSLQPHESQHARPPCPSPTPGVHSNSRPSSRWCHPAISSSVVPFSSSPHSLPASESFPTSQLFAWGGQSTGVSALASFLPKNTQDWSPLEWTGWISLQLTPSLSWILPYMAFTFVDTNLYPFTLINPNRFQRSMSYPWKSLKLKVVFGIPINTIGLIHS